MNGGGRGGGGGAARGDSGGDSRGMWRQVRVVRRRWRVDRVVGDKLRWQGEDGREGGVGGL